MQRKKYCNYIAEKAGGDGLGYPLCGIHPAANKKKGGGAKGNRWMCDVTTNVLEITGVFVAQRCTRRQKTKTKKLLLFSPPRWGRGEVPVNQRQKGSESSKATVKLKLRYGEFARPHRTRATVGSATAPALLPRLLALVCMRKEGQRGGRIASTIHEGYGRVGVRREVIGD
jgi:hypothetical protein